MEASAGHPEAAARRIEALKGISELPIDEEVQELAALLISKGGMPPEAEADALHVAVAVVHNIEFLLTWNCRHIDNAVTKPIIRSICDEAGYSSPEICTQLELLPEEDDNLQR